ncbi:hypothetical protein MACH09_45470 [Vibrio sp. MACH09]|uniref:hypothetical protein n=1 Tax=Vibrio sp. MACH09 TaxID=3025122 RepID=UPI0027938D45|nr:hypothetical protein [Vibrio sp. MACH09]GLO64039.1 hypothetical protein MACH09_45470 [Vibrio sp. MACH09]
MNDLIACLPDGLAKDLSDDKYNTWFNQFDQNFAKAKHLENLLESLNCVDSVSDIWEITENAKSSIKDRIKNIGTDVLTSSKANGSIYNCSKQALDSSRKIFLLEQGVDKRYLDNLDHWYRIYPVVKEIQQEMEGRDVQVTDEIFVKQISQRLKDKGIHTVTKESRLLDILFDFYHQPVHTNHEQLSIEEEYSLDDIEAIEMQLTRLELCFNKLKAFSSETYQILHQHVIEQVSAKSIFESMGISNTKFRARKEKGLELLHRCLEGQSQDALSVYEEDN